MARSKRKTPIFGNTTSSSEKMDKRRWNKRFRRVAKSMVLKDQEIPKKIEAVTNQWDGNKDGKHFFKKFIAKDMRK